MTTAILVKPDHPRADAIAERIRAALSRQGVEILSADRYTHADFITVVGGDGTIMHAAKRAAACGKPVLGVNAGRVGFLAGMEPDETSLLARLSRGDYTVESRMLLEVTFSNRGVPCTAYALNEVAVTRSGPARMMDIQVRVDDAQPLLTYRADGLLAATPTGSTAYSLSAGGPVLDPLIQGVVLTPVCPYSLQSRSLVFAADHTLRISAACRQDGAIFASVDGEEPVEITGQEITVRKATDRQVQLIRLNPDPFFNAYKNKIIDRSV